MARPKKPNPEIVKQCDTCLDALQFIDKLESKGNKTGRLHNTRRGVGDVWSWFVTYKEREK
jgi:hypothetical protein